MHALLERRDTAVPDEQDKVLAEAASRELATRKSTERLTVRVDDGKELVLPQAATLLLAHLLTEMAQGNAVTMIPIHAELTTQEAADYLNVSRPFFIGLLEKNQLKYRMVGTHRRVKFSDLVAFKKQSEETQKAAMDELVAQAQELGLGY